MATNAYARDEFNKVTREALARRIALRCSNPDRRKPTSGPRKDSTKAVTPVGLLPFPAVVADPC